MSSILVVDDSAFARQRLVSILADAGHQLIDAANGLEGLEKAQEHMPDCIVLDLLMPEMSGLEVLRTLKERGLTIPVIVVSADIQKTTQKECLELGAIAFMNKPFNENELIEIIQGILCAK